MINVLLWPLGLVLGCPCCGPRWYARLTIWSYKREGRPVPPELVGWQ